MRILVVETSLSDNGGLRLSLAYASRWRSSSGADVHVAVLKNGVAGAAVEPDDMLRVTPLTPPGRFRYLWPLAVVRLVRAARSCDVVVSGSEAGLSILFAHLAARIARRPLVAHIQADVVEAVRTWVPPAFRRWNLHVLRRVDAAVCVSDSVASRAIDNGLPASRAKVVGTGVDVAALRKWAAESAPASVVDGPGPLVVAVGRLSPQKDFPTLLRAHARVLASGIPHRLVLVGEGADRPDLETLVAALRLADSVELVGHLDNPLPVIASASLFVLSSRSEGMPLVLLEALALSTPIVSTRCGSGAEIVLDGGRCGRLVEVGDDAGLADAIAAHLSDPGSSDSLVRHGRAWVTRFDIGRSASAAYDVVLGLARWNGVRNPVEPG